MPPKSLTSPSPPTPEILDAQVVTGFFTQLERLTSTAGFNAIQSVHEENTKLHGLLKSKDHELKSLRAEMDERERKKETVVNEIIEANKREKGKHNETKEQMSSLQKVIQDKEMSISKRDKRIDECEKQVRSLQSENANERGKLADADKKIDTLQKSIQDKEAAIDKMKSVGAGLKEKLSSLKKRITELEDETSSLKDSLAAAQVRLKKLESFAAGHSEVNEDKLFESYWGLWEFAKTEIYAQLKIDFPSDTLRNISAWDRLRQCDVVRTHQIPLPCSNTIVAKQMRLAVILAILAREIDTHIFQPIYIAPIDEQFRRVLTDLAATDTEKESFCRSILLSMNPGIQSRRCSASVRTVVTNVSAYLDELLPKDQRHVFHRSLEQVVQKAADTWKPIQCSRRKYETDFEPAIDDDDWELFEYPKPDNTVAEKSANDKNQPTIALTVFPCLSVIENQASTAYTPAIRLSSSQYQWIAAQREIAKEPASATLGRAFTWRRKPGNPKSLSSANGGPKKRNGS